MMDKLVKELGAALNETEKVAKDEAFKRNSKGFFGWLFGSNKSNGSSVPSEPIIIPIKK